MWTTLKKIKKHNDWIWQPNRKKDTIWSKASSCWRKLKQASYLEDTKNNMMTESDNQTEKKTTYDPRHPVGRENWSKWTTLKKIKKHNDWIWQPNRKKDTIWSKASSWWRKLKQASYLEDTKNNIMMTESDNQTEKKTTFDPRHPVGRENWSKWTTLKKIKKQWLNLTTKQKKRNHLIQGIQLVEKIEASELTWRH